jgi:hypothetical protein
VLGERLGLNRSDHSIICARDQHYVVPRTGRTESPRSRLNEDGAMNRPLTSALDRYAAAGS